MPNKIIGGVVGAILATGAALGIGALVQVYYSDAPLLSAWGGLAVGSFLVTFLIAGWILQRYLG